MPFTCVPSGITGPGPVAQTFFGDGEQTFLQNDLAISFDLFRGQQAFQPVDWRIRVTPVFNFTSLSVQEVGVVQIDPSKGTTRDRGDVAMQLVAERRPECTSRSTASSTAGWSA